VNHLSDDERVERTHNIPRFFVEHHAIAWLLMVLVIAWGVFAYNIMPKLKDPKTSAREALVIVEWPGASATQVEQLLTKRIEGVIAQNDMVSEIRSESRPGEAMVNLMLDEFHTKDTAKEFDDVGVKLAQIGDLPEGVGPLQYFNDYGDTATLMLTVASPPIPDAEINLRAQKVQSIIEAARRSAGNPKGAVSIVFCIPHDVEPTDLTDTVQQLSGDLLRKKLLLSAHVLPAPGAVLLDGISGHSDAELSAALTDFSLHRVGVDELHPDIWSPVVIHDPTELQSKLRRLSPSKYSSHELDVYTDAIARSLQKVEEVTKVDRTEVAEEQVHLTFDPDRLASAHLNPFALPELFHDRNVVTAGGEINAGSQIEVTPHGALHSINDLQTLPLPPGKGRSPVRLKDVVSIDKGYQTPPTFLNFLTYRDRSGQWQRGRAITITADMRQGRQIAAFAKAVNTNLEDVEKLVPSDLIIERTSDQPRQVKENVSLFTNSLWEAVGLVVLVSLVGFWNWRSAALMAASIPITLAMTLGFMAVVKIDLQQVAIASLIIALGLLIDDPVVAGDAIQRELSAGTPRATAAWLGPTKLSRAILFATITSVLAYIPFLLLRGDIGQFIRSLPVVITCSLIASRIVSMTFVPLLGQLLLRRERSAGAPPLLSDKPQHGFASLYYDAGRWAIAHRKAVLASSLLFLLAGGLLVLRLDSSFFPYDLQYLSYADVWLPEGATFAETRAASEQVEEIIKSVSARYAEDRKPAHPGTPVLKSLTTFVGGGGPRFWDSVSPEPPHPNYAEVLIETLDKRDTNALVPLLQAEISKKVAGARVDLRQLETGPEISAPVSIRILGPDPATLLKLSAQLQGIFRADPLAARVRDDWGKDRTALSVQIDPEKAARAGVSNQDVARSLAMNTSGLPVGNLLDGDQMIPIILRQRHGERSLVSDARSQYVYRASDGERVPLEQVASLNFTPQIALLRHYNRSRAITISCYPATGALASTVLKRARPQIDSMVRNLPAGYSLTVAGEYKEQKKGFSDLAVALGVSVLTIYLALVTQFKNIVKPLIVFAAIPFGCVGAFIALALMKEPFGFMAFLGVASLIGVIVSHIIVLFDRIEERYEERGPLLDTLLDAGLLRLRPVFITVSATAFALIPLALHGGPLWKPLCYAEIGGLLLSGLVTLLLVPTLYAFFVLDLKWITWKAQTEAKPDEHAPVQPA
jgi:multidrug efflux pump subunit AcrB